MKLTLILLTGLILASVCLAGQPARRCRARPRVIVYRHGGYTINCQPQTYQGLGMRYPVPIGYAAQAQAWENYRRRMLLESLVVAP